MVNGNLSGSDVSFNGGAVKACGGCGGRIHDRFLLHAMDRYWHTECLKCSCCQTTLEQLGTCFARSGMILCKNDYMRLFGSGGSCASCGQNIPAHEMVMRVHGNTYHLKCFTCVACNTQLTPGNRYAIINGNIVCEQDYPKVTKAQVGGSSRNSTKIHGMMTKI
ncbi:hypothetical protein FSP39_008378 [Pinctada imbricata]|uniref:LIM zinc-binding domain-containing protein n=1 Tax=Pinctada imbricata TaxID=66713 RepID=A0AA89BN60_PINIB|nr:hypothetical protein FSP39_008378 [Pinctada imbricata]